MDNENPTEKKQMTHEERLELAAKLDKELDQFISSLPKKKYEDGWPEDRWEEEMEKHPFFMTKAPEPGAELHPLYQGLQKLKYDPEENEPEELAISYKEDGNFNFKYKNYRLAILSYTEGIKIKCGNIEIEATLLNNRAAAHFFLGNYRSALKDCELALKLKPDYEKALLRAALCCCESKKFDLGIKYCNKILELNKDHKTAQNLLRKCLHNLKVLEKNERKKLLEKKKKISAEKALLDEIYKRGVRLEGEKNSTLESCEPIFPQLMGHRVHLDSNNCLVWPVVFVYPEYKVMDFVQEFNENTSFEEILETFFKEPAEWDTNKAYNVNTINIYFQTLDKKLRTVRICDTLGMILALKEYVVQAGTPSFIILVRNSAAENTFLEQY